MIGIHFSKIQFLLKSFSFLLLFAILNPAFAGTFKINEHYVYYDIKGRTAEKLRKGMREGGLNDAWGHARIKYRDAGNCHIIAEITYTLPKWINYNEGSPRLQRKWDKMIEVMTRHEENHGKNYIAGVKEFAAADCTREQEIYDKWAKVDSKYDRRTRHGRNEGIKLR